MYSMYTKNESLSSLKTAYKKYNKNRGQRNLALLSPQWYTRDKNILLTEFVYMFCVFWWTWYSPVGIFLGAECSFLRSNFFLAEWARVSFCWVVKTNGICFKTLAVCSRLAGLHPTPTPPPPLGQNFEVVQQDYSFKLVEAWNHDVRQLG